MDTFSVEGMEEMKNFLNKIRNFFTKMFGRKELFKQVFDKTFDIAADALPIVNIASAIVTGVTPTKIDDVILASIKAKYPRLFDGSIHTGDELKLYTLGVATELVKAKYPDVSTSVARLAVQSAFTTSKIETMGDKTIK
jgi:hypothetical protein